MYFKEFVTRDLLFWSSFLSILPDPNPILRKLGKTNEAYRELMHDPHVYSCIQSRKAGITSFDYTIESNNANAFVVNEISNIFKNLDVNQLERDILEAPLFGYQPLEILWKKFPNNKIYPENIVSKPQEWFFFDSDNVLRVKTKDSFMGLIPPPWKILNVQYEARYNNPYGHALLSDCLYPVIFKNGGLRFWVNFTERYGMPFLISNYTRGATMDESRLLAEELAKMIEDAVIVAPSDVKIEFKEPQRTSSYELYKELINICNSNISKAILSQTLTTEIQTGSFAAAQTHFKIRREIIMSDIKLIENAIDTIIEWICKLNWNINLYPCFKIIVSDADNMQKVHRDIQLSEFIEFSKEYWMESYGFKESDITSIISNPNKSITKINIPSETLNMV